MSARTYIIRRFHQIDTGGLTAWFKLHHQLNQDSDKQEAEEYLDVSDGTSIANEYKNRYCDIFPYNHNRVLLGDSSIGGTNYINASQITCVRANRRYILAQAPLQNTTAEFWQMCWDQKLHVIVMLNKFALDPHEQQCRPCGQYVPEVVDKTEIYGPFEVTVTKETVERHYTTRELRLCKSDDQAIRNITHFQYTRWPDLGVPLSTEHFLEFLKLVRDTGYLDSTKYDSPVLVHCLAGIGRSGTFVVVDSVLSMIERNGDLTEQDIDLCAVLLKMRRDRMFLVQTHEQLRFAWQTVVDALTKPQWKCLTDE